MQRQGQRYQKKGYSPNHPVIIVPGLCSSAMKVIESPHKEWINRRIWLDVTTIGFSKVLDQLPLRRMKNKLKNSKSEIINVNAQNETTATQEQNRRRWIAHMVLQKDGISDPIGIKLRPIETIDAIMYLDPGAITNALSYVFGPLIETLWDIGYTETNLQAAPYDWRIPPGFLEYRDSYFTKLKDRIDNMFGVEDKKVILLAHSLGTRCIHYFLRFCERNFGRKWITEKIHTWIPVGPLWLGAPKSVRASVSGERMGLDAFLYEDEGILLSRACGSSAWMFPYIVPDYEFEDYIFVRDEEQKWRSKSLQDALIESDVKNIWDGYIHNYHHDPCFGTQNEQLAPPPIDKMYAIYGINLKTEIFYFYKESANGKTKFELDSSGSMGNNFECCGGIASETKETAQNKLRGGRRSGDGTVPYASLSYCSYWRNEIDVSIEELEGADHREILKDKTFTRLIVEYVCHSPAAMILPDSFKPLSYKIFEISLSDSQRKERKLTLTNKGIWVQTKKGDTKYHKKYSSIDSMLTNKNFVRIKFKKNSSVYRYETENAGQIVQESDYRIKYIHNTRATVEEPIDEKGQTELLIAVNQNEISLVRELLSDDRNVNAQDNQGWSALHIAVEKKYNDIVSLLLRQPGINVNIQSKGFTVPLIYSLRNNIDEDSEEIWDSFFYAGADVNFRGLKEMTPLHEVITRPGGFRAARWLIGKGANLNALNDSGDTPLHFAALQNDKELIALLLEHGADRHIQNKSQESPLRVAQSVSTDLLTFMLDYQPSGYSARANQDYIADNIEELTFYEGNIISKICIISDYKEGWWYGECGGLGGYFPSACIETKLAKLGEPEPNDATCDTRDEYGQTPLHKASLDGSCETVFNLIQSEANINALDRNGWTPVHCAANKQNLDILLALTMQANVDLSKRNKDFSTPLHYVAKIIPQSDLEQKKLAQILSRFVGSNINAISADGETPLHRAVFARNLFVTKFLLEKNATVDIQNGVGITPLFYAVDERDKLANIDIIKLLLRYEADASIQTKHGSPVEVAVSGFNSEILNLLHEYKAGNLETISQVQEKHSRRLRRNTTSFIPAAVPLANDPIFMDFPVRKQSIAHEDEVTEIMKKLLESNFRGDISKFRNFTLQFLEQQEKLQETSNTRNNDSVIGNRASSGALQTRKRANRVCSSFPSPVGVVTAKFNRNTHSF